MCSIPVVSTKELFEKFLRRAEQDYNPSQYSGNMVKDVSELTWEGWEGEGGERKGNRAWGCMGTVQVVILRLQPGPIQRQHGEGPKVN